MECEFTFGAGPEFPSVDHAAGARLLLLEVLVVRQDARGKDGVVVWTSLNTTGDRRPLEGRGIFIVVGLQRNGSVNPTVETFVNLSIQVG